MDTATQAENTQGSPDSLTIHGFLHLVSHMYSKKHKEENILLQLFGYLRSYGLKSVI